MLNTIWKGMKTRCYNPKVEAYRYYGARGITVWPDWQTFVGFLDWALDSAFEPGKQIDRIDADGPYSPANCRWVWPQINRGRMDLERSGEYLLTLAGKLTQEAAVAAPTTGVAYKIPDGGGLFLFVSRFGKKSWRYRFMFDGRDQTLTFGKLERLNIWDAREAHAIAKARLARGLNPAEMKQAAKRRRQA